MPTHLLKHLLILEDAVLFKQLFFLLQSHLIHVRMKPCFGLSLKHILLQLFDPQYFLNLMVSYLFYSELSPLVQGQGHLRI
jgi:hypothetical protein